MKKGLHLLDELKTEQKLIVE